MITRYLCSRVRMLYVDPHGHCALWVECLYMVPFGQPTWTVRVHPMGGDSIEVGRARWLWLAAWRGLRKLR